jgi:TrmH family RNA methyltransferase
MDQLALVRRALSGSDELFVIDDARNIRAAIDAGVEVVARLDQLARSDREELFPTGRPPKALAVARLPPPSRPKAVAALGGDVFVLDGLEGGGNVGAVIRSAAAFDFAGVIALDARRRQLYRRSTIRAAGPAMFRLPLLTMDMGSLRTFLARNDIELVAASPHRGSDNCVRSPRLAIALGSEVRGCSAPIEEAAVGYWRIPTSDATESLNVSAVAAILAYARYRLHEGRQREAT